MRHRTSKTRDRKVDQLAAGMNDLLAILDTNTPVEQLPADTRRRIAEARDLADQNGDG
ncbi:MAG TPA: hypothetical protein VJT49_16675 [Amycolatopsis sp.]|uniref:hypothetical protein n=1 Tax=Amycolatopsis sp. TaxID=37632 RepID=UPI002B49C226|nr:hypothetical protein [Amycolatopsis sp.]HKS46709.1 hypothetical protein [Amycolatopsis sp.]